MIEGKTLEIKRCAKNNKRRSEEKKRTMKRKGKREKLKTKI
jgi:hypothetical protein